MKVYLVWRTPYEGKELISVYKHHYDAVTKVRELNNIKKEIMYYLTEHEVE